MQSPTSGRVARAYVPWNHEGMIFLLHHKIPARESTILKTQQRNAAEQRKCRIHAPSPPSSPRPDIHPGLPSPHRTHPDSLVLKELGAWIQPARARSQSFAVQPQCVALTCLVEDLLVPTSWADREERYEARVSMPCVHRYWVLIDWVEREHHPSKLLNRLATVSISNA